MAGAQRQIETVQKWRRVMRWLLNLGPRDWANVVANAFMEPKREVRYSGECHARWNSSRVEAGSTQERFRSERDRR
jgi:hypothetical protein